MTYQINIEVRINVNSRSQVNVRSELKSKWSGDSQGNPVGIKIDIPTREYHPNYKFKYLKSVAESGSIVITVST